MKITLCGSARFEPQWREWNEKLSMAGHVVYSLAVYPSSKEGQKEWYDNKQKITLDLVHLAKIEESSGIVVINVGGYVGDSTRREIEWARMRGKWIHLVELSDEDRGLGYRDAALLLRAGPNPWAEVV